MSIHIDPLEKRWIGVIAGILIFTWAIIVYYAAADNVRPPSNVEVIDSSKLHLASGVGGGEFMEKNLGVKEDAQGNVTVTMVAARYGFYPLHIQVPFNKPVKFRIASFDVLHGMLVPFSNMNVMVVPGYISEITTTFTRLGKSPLICHEYCGQGHAYMYGMIDVVPEDKFKPKTGVK